MTEEERQEWNAAIVRGDTDKIRRLQNTLLRAVYTRIMDEDANYAQAGWRP